MTTIVVEQDGAIVIEQVRSYLSSLADNPNGIPYLSRVFAYPEKVTPEQDFFQRPGIGAGGFIYLWFGDSDDEVLAWAGPSVSLRWLEYRVTMRCIFRAMEQDSQIVGAQNEQFISGIISAIHQSRNAGSPPPVPPDGINIFSWGLGGKSGGPDIKIVRYLPTQVEDQLAAVQVVSNIEVVVAREVYR